MIEPIRGKVAKVLNSREMALNVGSEHGIKMNMYFDIIDLSGDNIIDPETGESLGSIDRPKVRVKITKVQNRLSVASTYKRTQINIGGQGLADGFATHAISRMLMPQKWVTKYETLNTEEKTWEDLDENRSYVKVSDPVVQVLTKVDDDADTIS